MPHSPHCDCDGGYVRRTSSCRSPCGSRDWRRKGYEITRTISRPVHRLRTPCRCASGVPSHVYQRYAGCCREDPEVCMCYECRKVLGRSEAAVRNSRRRFCEHRSQVMEGWFTRFDKDGDGYLNLEDLEYLMDHLGVRGHTQKLFKICDNDCDGRISFSEFVRLWRRVGVHDQELIGLTGCCDLPRVVKKYNLYLDSECPLCCDCRVTIATEHPISAVNCKCGLAERILPFVKHETSKKPDANKKKNKAELDAEDPDAYPIMSLNRDNII